MNKLVAALLAIALVFGAVSVMASAANENPYVKISSISNVALESKAQTVTVSLSPDTELKNASIVLSYDKTALADVSVVNADNKVDKDIKISSGAENGKITLNVDSAANTDKTNEMTLFTIKFDFAKGTKGLVELTAAVAPIVTEDDAKATIGAKEFGASLVIGEEKEAVYSDLAGIALKGAVKAAGKPAPRADAKVVVTLKPFEGEGAMAPVADFELAYTDAICTKPVATDSQIKEFLDTKESDITARIQAVDGNSEITYDDFDVEKAVITREPADAKTYAEGTSYVWHVTLKQLKKTTAKIEVIFRPAFEDTTLYHSSDIAPFEMSLEVNAGKTVKSQTEILSYIKTYSPTIDQYIKSQSADKYGIDDFVLDESVVEFNGAKMTGKETFVEGGENVYTVYFDQVNVPSTVLGTAAQALGSIDYSQFVKAQVFAINETIDAFKAMVDSLVNAEWPTADDVKEEDKDDSKSPSTGSSLSLGFALASVVALASAAVVAVKRKED